MSNPRTIEGVYRDGRVELSQMPHDVREARVLVVFLDEVAAGEVNGAPHTEPAVPPHVVTPPPLPTGALAPVAALPVLAEGPGPSALAAPVALQWAPSAALTDAASAGAILDYASPRPRTGRVRLPATSTLQLVRLPNGTSVIERLSGQSRAIGALLFAGFVLLVVGLQGVLQFRSYREGAILLWVFWFAEAALIPFVINNTWRRTVLTATADKLTLIFLSPFKSKTYDWQTDQTEDVRLVRTQQNLPTLAELQIHVAGYPVVKLFTDHLERELVTVRQALLEGMARGVRQTGPPTNRHESSRIG